MSRFISAVVDKLPLKDTFYTNLGKFVEGEKMYYDFVEEIKGISAVMEI